MIEPLDRETLDQFLSDLFLLCNKYGVTIGSNATADDDSNLHHSVLIEQMIKPSNKYPREIILAESPQGFPCKLDDIQFYDHNSLRTPK